MERYFGYATDAAGTLDIAPLCAVAVYDAGTSNLAAIYADELSTVKANPFTPDSTAFFYFYAPAGRYDVRFSGTGITVAFTWADVQLLDTYLLARTDIGNNFTGNQNITGNLVVTGSLTVGGTAILNSSGKIPALSSTYFASLNGASLTSLDASQLASGTLPSARLSGTYSEALTLSSVSNLLAGASVSLGAAPSTTGAVRLSYNEGIYSANSAAVDTLLIKLGTSDTLELANATTGNLTPSSDDAINFGTTALRYRNGHIKDLYSSMLAFGYSLVATVGAVRLGNDSTYAIAFRDVADSANKLFYLNAADQFVLGAVTTVTGNFLPTTDDTYDLGSASKQWQDLSLSGIATVAEIDLGNAFKMQLSGGSYVTMLEVNGSNQLVLGHASYDIKLARPVAAIDSGAATLGDLPAGASAFHGWIPLYTSAGTPVWVPCFE